MHRGKGRRVQEAGREKCSEKEDRVRIASDITKLATSSLNHKAKMVGRRPVFRP